MEKIEAVYIIMDRYEDVDGGEHLRVASAAYLSEEEAQKECDKRNSSWAEYEKPYFVMMLAVE